MKREAGFTVIEILVTAVILLTASGLFLYQKNHIQASFRDEKRKTDINTLYHNLEKVYFAKNNFYPQELTEMTLPAVQPDTFKDPNGIMINDSKPSGVPGVASTQSDYRYTPKDCNLETGQCKQYELRTSLENEQTYIKTSQKTK